MTKIWATILILAFIIGAGTYFWMHKKIATQNNNTVVTTCQTKNLAVSLTNGNGTAGTYYYTLMLANTGTQSCTISGSPKISALDSNGKVTGETIPAIHTSETLTLAPNSKAYANLGFPNSGNFSAGVCKPVKSLVVYPPDQTTGLTIANIDTYSSTYTGQYCQAYAISDFSQTAP